MFSRGKQSYSPLRRPLALLGGPRAVEALRDRLPDPFFEIDPLEELDRVFSARPQRFRLQFFAVADDRGPSVIAEAEIQAAGAVAAIRATAESEWPPRAIGVRILDREGREIFERLRADRR
jgi:hypothetical protein